MKPVELMPTATTPVAGLKWVKPAAQDLIETNYANYGGVWIRKKLLDGSAAGVVISSRPTLLLGPPIIRQLFGNGKS